MKNLLEQSLILLDRLAETIQPLALFRYYLIIRILTQFFNLI